MGDNDCERRLLWETTTANNNCYGETATANGDCYGEMTTANNDCYRGDDDCYGEKQKWDEGGW